MRISGRMIEITAMAHTCVPKWMNSARQEIGGIIIETQRSHVAQIVVHKCRCRWDGRAEPARRPGGLGRFFFPGVPEEADTFTPTWMRSLQ
jgi:hypothetical protein